MKSSASQCSNLTMRRVRQSRQYRSYRLSWRNAACGRRVLLRSPVPLPTVWAAVTSLLVKTVWSLMLILRVLLRKPGKWRKSTLLPRLLSKSSLPRWLSCSRSMSSWRRRMESGMITLPLRVSRRRKQRRRLPSYSSRLRSCLRAVDLPSLQWPDTCSPLRSSLPR